MPYETPNGCVYDSGDYPAALDLVLELDAVHLFDATTEGRIGSQP